MKKNLAFLLAGMALLIFANGRWAVPVLAWVAPVFLLRFARSARPLIGLPLLAVLFVGAARLMLAGIIPSGLGTLGWLLTAYFGLLWFMPYLLDRLLGARPADFLSTLIFPCASVAVEYLNAVALGNWGSTALTQLDNLPFVQLLSLTGLWGITFLVAWFAPVALWVRENRCEWRRVRSGIAVFAGVLIAVFLYGGLRLSLTPPLGPTVRVASLHLDDAAMAALTSPGPGANASAADPGGALAAKRKALDAYFAGSADCARQGASIIFWPEAAVSIDRGGEADFLARAAGLARETGVYFMPAYHLEPAADGTARGENKCAMFDPSGREAWRYIKAHPVPGSPDAPGAKTIPVIDTPFGRVAAAICYDMDFPSLVRQAGRRRADIVLVPAWDWRAIDPLHSAMAACRAVENGFAMVRHSVEGLSLAVDGLGRRLAALDHFQTSRRVMFADVPTRRIRTVYSSVGDGLAWLSLAGLAAFAIGAIFRRKRRGRKSDII